MHPSLSFGFASQANDMLPCRYWLPPSPDKFDPHNCFTGCTIERYADMQDLAHMPVGMGVEAAEGSRTYL